MNHQKRLAHAFFFGLLGIALVAWNALTDVLEIQREQYEEELDELELRHEEELDELALLIPELEAPKAVEAA